MTREGVKEGFAEFLTASRNLSALLEKKLGCRRRKLPVSLPSGSAFHKVLTSAAIVWNRTCVSRFMIYEFGVPFLHSCIAELDTVSLSLDPYLNIKPFAMGYVSKLLIMELLTDKYQVSLPFHEDNKWCLHTCWSAHLGGCYHQEGMASLRCRVCFPSWRIQDLH